MRMTDQRAVTTVVVLVAIDCATCGVPFGITEDMQERRRKDGASFYCPNGHNNVYKGGNVDQLKDRVRALEAELSSSRVALQKTKEANSQIANDLLDKVKELDGLKRRVHAGVCPWCHRNFKQLRQHCDRKHPDKRLPSQETE